MVVLQRYEKQTEDFNSDLFFWRTFFPVRWWRPLLTSSRVRLGLRGRGKLTVRGRRGDEVIKIDRVKLDGEHQIVIDTGEFDYVWVDPVDRSAVEMVTWSVRKEVELPQVTVVMPTFNREEDAVAQASRFLSDPLVGRVLVIDQGRTLHLFHPFLRLRRGDPERLKLIQQDNLGGSGGYARGMMESMRWPDDAVLNSDDDAVLPAESLRRLVVAQALSRSLGNATIMGTAMLSAENPTEVHSLSEWVEPGSFMWGPADGLNAILDVSQDENAPLDRLIPEHQPNYTGWWGTLLPPGTVANVGLPAPYFIKWDDAEYGLRAANLGYRFLSLPGVGVWHPTWGAKSTVGSWMSMPLHRNRLVTAAAYGSGRGVIKDSFIHQIKHILSLQYLPAELWAAGIDQVISGSDWLGRDLRSVRERAQNIVGLGKPTKVAGGAAGIPSSTLSGPKTALSSMTGLVRPARSKPRVVRVVPAGNLTWRDGLGADLVLLADQEGVPRRQIARSPLRAVRLLAKTIRQHVVLMLRWGTLQSGYREALKDCTTTDYWLTQFEDQTPVPPLSKEEGNR